MTIPSAQITAAFSEWLDLMHELDPVAWGRQCARVVTMFSAEDNCVKLLGFIIELVDPSYGVAVQLPDDYGKEQAEFCRLFREAKYKEAGAAIPKILALGQGLAENAESVYLGNLTDAHMGTLVSIALVGHNFNQYLITATNTNEGVAKVVCMCTYQLLCAHFLEGGSIAAQSVLEYVAKRLEAVLN